MFTRKLHHIAYRCINAQETVDFYTKVLCLPYTMAMSEDRVPSTHEPDPYMHIFFDIGDGSYLAFFEVPNSPKMVKDANTPAWVQHLALEVEDEDALLKAKEHIEGFGIEVIGPTDHSLFKSIYCFDPNGHRLELACNTAPPEVWEKVAKEAPAMLEEWNKTHSVVKHTSWVHDNELNQ